MEREDAEAPYRRWLAATHAAAHVGRTAEREGAFFLPYLKPGMRLLDAGCGPGTITLGLARAVASEEVLGIDINPAVIQTARANAASAGVTNVCFEVIDLHEPRLQKERFDAVFAHALLQHLPDAARSVRLIRSMLKDGGVAGLGDADYHGSVIAPQSPDLRRALRLMERIRRHTGGDPFVGAKLRLYLAESGFREVVGTAAANCHGTAAATALTGDWWAAYLDAPAFIARSAERHWGDEAALGRMAAAWRTWGRHPGAYWATFWCHAIGRA